MISLSRLGAAAQNALEVARFGGLETGEESSPYEVRVERRTHRLRRYFPLTPAGERPPIILVPPLMVSTEVYDVSTGSTAVGVLHEHGLDPWVVDFGAPEHEEGGLERTLADHVIAVSESVDVVREHSGGRAVHLSGYSQGGMFCYQAAAFRRSEGVASIVTFGSPVDTLGALPFGIPESVAAAGAEFLADQVLGRMPIPAWVSRNGFRLIDPVKALRQQVDFVMGLHDREALLPRERQRQFLQAEGWVAWPGPAAADLMRQFVVHNRLLRGGFEIEEQLVTLADLTCPILCFVGDLDQIGVPAAVRAIGIAAPRAAIYERSLRAGHFGLVVGGTATRVTWPTVAGWALAVEAGGVEEHLPEGVVPLRDPSSEEAEAGTPGVVARVGHGVGLAVGVYAGLARSTVAAASDAAGAMVELGQEAATALPRLGRLERIQPHTRVSLGSLLAERAAHHPSDACFLFEGRVHRQAAVATRIDNVVRGLISQGVRQGEHVGVLMNTRPSALVLIAALSRLGAVAVLMRPDGPIEREAELGEVTRVIADPECAGAAVAALGPAGLGPAGGGAASGAAGGGGAVPVLVLGGGGGPRDLGAQVSPDVLDMERIDPDAVRLPQWYEPNPGRARDIAFILFTGEGERTRLSRITNGRWALSAFGTASAAALTATDTVYSITPLYHPSALLMSVGGAFAGGARLALATRFDPETFWTDVRRYGVTVCSYTWTLLHAIVDAPWDVAERHHPIRLFIGSGMPRGLWRRVAVRFAPARVLEFYASTEGAAILVNMMGSKPGCKGRRLPGSAQVRIAGYDPVAGRLLQDEDGLARACAAGETGMLLARVADRSLTPSENALRGVFARGDAWMATGDLFRRDLDGDHWLVDHVGALVRTASGVVAGLPIQDALADLDEVELAVVYGVPVSADGSELAVAAVTLRGGAVLRPGALTRTLGGIEPAGRPSVVRVVADIPVTTWFRPLAGPLRAQGIPAEGGELPAWAREAGGGYRALTATSRRQLLAGARARTRASRAR